MESHEGELSERVAAISDLVEYGYTLLADNFDEEHFGDRLLLLNQGSINLRLLRDRGQWFADLAFAGDPDEWFDSAIVFRDLGEPGVFPPDTVGPLVKRLLETRDRWEPLFSRASYAETRQRLKALERKSAEERFGYTPP